MNTKLFLCLVFLFSITSCLASDQSLLEDVADLIRLNSQQPQFYEKFAKQEEDHRLSFDTFISQFNKKYKNEEEKNRRFQTFRINLSKIDLLNRREQGSAKYGVTRFADMTAHEFSQMHGLRRDMVNEVEHNSKRISVPDDISLPTSFDWRDKGAVSEVKDQGFCGSCWAFSVTGNIEGQVAIVNKTLISLSEQELVDCDKRDNGCGGGFMTIAYKSVMELGMHASQGSFSFNESCLYSNF